MVIDSCYIILMWLYNYYTMSQLCEGRDNILYRSYILSLWYDVKLMWFPKLSPSWIFLNKTDNFWVLTICQDPLLGVYFVFPCHTRPCEYHPRDADEDTEAEAEQPGRAPQPMCGSRLQGYWAQILQSFTPLPFREPVVEKVLRSWTSLPKTVF